MSVSAQQIVFLFIILIENTSTAKDRLFSSLVLDTQVSQNGPPSPPKLAVGQIWEKSCWAQS